MKKAIMTVALAACFAVGMFAAVALASNGNGGGPPTAPPGQGECEHGNSGQECKPDPQPEHGQDCDEHGNHGGVNEDHCTPTETTPTDTHPTDTTPTHPTPTEPTPTTPVTQPCPDGGPHNAGKDGQVPGSGNTNDDCDRSVPPVTTTTPPVSHPVAPAEVTTTATTATPATPATPAVKKAVVKKAVVKKGSSTVVVHVTKKKHGVVVITTADGKKHVGAMGSG